MRHRLFRLMTALALATLGAPADGQSTASRESPQTSASRPPASDAPIVVASKPFGESYLLAEIFAQLLEARGFAVTRKPGLGATEIAFPALRRGDIDVFPEYTGTGLAVILKAPPESDPQRVYDIVSTEFPRRYDMRWLGPLGFENTYAMSVRTSYADSLKLRTLSDLARISPQVRAGFTADFIGLPDGLPGLTKVYGLVPKSVVALAPAVKYQALVNGQVDVIDAYSTDGLLGRYPLTVLEDDRRFFPPYDAAAIVRGEVARQRPDAVLALSELSGRLDVRRMRALNERLEIGGEQVEIVARRALVELGLVADSAALSGGGESEDGARLGLAGYFWAERGRIATLVRQHLTLTGVSLFLAVLIGIPLGLLLERTRAAEAIVRAVGVTQTIPGIALLAFMLPVLGIGAVPAIVALFIYSLYPIVRNTLSAVRAVEPSAAESALALGMTPRQVLRHVRFPLGLPVILAGVRTAAVLNVGTATLAAFVGGGGLGEPMVSGLALADSRMVLSGAIPAAVLAVVVDLLLGWLTHRLSPSLGR